MMTTLRLSFTITNTMATTIMLAIPLEIAISFFSRISVVKPSSIVVRVEYQPTAPDLSPKRFNFHGGVSSSSSSRRRDLVFVVNPRGANGRTGEEWKRLIPFLRSRLGTDCNVDMCEFLNAPNGFSNSKQSMTVNERLETDPSQSLLGGRTDVFDLPFHMARSQIEESLQTKMTSIKERMFHLQDAQKDAEVTSEVSERELELEAQLVEARSIIQEQASIMSKHLAKSERSRYGNQSTADELNALYGDSWASGFGPEVGVLLHYESELSVFLLPSQNENSNGALPKIIKTGFASINLIYFFAAGPDEVKCWQIRQQSKAPQATGAIHTDFERGFICAEAALDFDNYLGKWDLHHGFLGKTKLQK